MEAIINYFCDQIADKVANKQNALEWFVAILSWLWDLGYTIILWGLNNLVKVAIFFLIAAILVIIINWIISREPPF